jgi:hypothetical protein
MYLGDLERVTHRSVDELEDIAGDPTPATTSGSADEDLPPEPAPVTPS